MPEQNCSNNIHHFIHYFTYMRDSFNRATQVLGTPITGRNKSQQKLGVAQKELDDKLTELHIPSFEALTKDLEAIRSVVSGLQNKLQQAREGGQAMAALEIIVRDAFRRFIQRVVQISEGGIDILRLVDPNIPEHMNSLERTALVESMMENGSIDAFSEHLTHAQITEMQVQINTIQSRDFADVFREVSEPWERLYAKRTAFPDMIDPTPGLEENLRKGQVKQSELEQKYNVLKPLSDAVDRSKLVGARWTVASRVTSAAVGAVLGGVISYTAPSSTTSAHTNEPCPADTIKQTSASHGIRVVGNTVQVSPNGSVALALGGEHLFQFNLTGDVNELKGSLVYKKK